MWFQDAPYSLYPAQCGPWHWAGENPYPITTLPDGTAWLSLHSLRCSAHQTALLSLLSWLPASSPHFPNWITLLHWNFHCCQSKTTALYHAVRHTKQCFVYAGLSFGAWVASTLVGLFVSHFWRPQSVFSELWHLKLRQSDASAHNHPGDKR